MQHSNSHSNVKNINHSIITNLNMGLCNGRIGSRLQIALFILSKFPTLPPFISTPLSPAYLILPEYLYNMKGNVMASMEKGNVCILWRQRCLNKNISHPIVTRGLFPLVSTCLFVWKQVIKSNLKVNRNRAITLPREIFI